MNKKIKDHIIAFHLKNGYEPEAARSEPDIINTITEGDILWSGDKSSRRWWNDIVTVVEIDGMLIGFDNAETTGDDSPEDKGWEFDPDSIKEYRKKVTTIEVTKYIPFEE